MSGSDSLAVDAAKVVTDFDVAALLRAPVELDGRAVPLRSVLAGKHTILLFVRNGA